MREPGSDGHRDVASPRSPMRCAGCGFDLDASVAVSARVLGSVGELVDPALGRGALERPAPTVWSTAEYLAHLGDALRFYRARILLVTSSPSPPLLASWDPDEPALVRSYALSDPASALARAVREGRSLQRLLGALSSEDAERTGIGSDGGPRTVAELAARAAHEVVHHGGDVARGGAAP